MPARDAGELAWIQGVGYPRPNHSHFRSMDIWESGSDSDEVLEQGWLARALPVRAPCELPDVVVLGGDDGPARDGDLRIITLASAERFVEDARRLQPLDAPPAHLTPALDHLLTVRAATQAAGAEFRPIHRAPRHHAHTLPQERHRPSAPRSGAHAPSRHDHPRRQGPDRELRHSRRPPRTPRAPLGPVGRRPGGLSPNTPTHRTLGSGPGDERLGIRPPTRRERQRRDRPRHRRAASRAGRAGQGRTLWRDAESRYTRRGRSQAYCRRPPPCHARDRTPVHRPNGRP